ncbi:MAG: hypothetical protein DBO99_01710 [gamma proteobacterium symbiont of Ctena orbiculata]|nr:MAG: hypothetical protein DBO99_01710 [gamma proteobacterium symbiont of Ctena orbiculata]
MARADGSTGSIIGPTGGNLTILIDNTGQGIGDVAILVTINAGWVVIVITWRLIGKADAGQQTIAVKLIAINMSSAVGHALQNAIGVIGKIEGMAFPVTDLRKPAINITQQGGTALTVQLFDKTSLRIIKL